MVKKRVPRRLWDYGFIWICETNNLSVSSSRYAKGRTPIEMITGETPDISEYTNFSFYDWVMYRTNAGLGEISLGRWLGVSHKIGKLMSYWILTPAGKVISCTMVQRPTYHEKQTDEWKRQMELYTTYIDDRLSDSNFDLVDIMMNKHPHNRLPMQLDNMDAEFTEEFQKVIDNENVPHAIDDIKQDLTSDNYLHMSLNLPRGFDDSLEHAVVKRRVVNVEGNPIGIANPNPLLDTRQYEVEYDDGTQETLSANVIAENILYVLFVKP